MSKQTTVSDSNTLQLGSCKIEIGASAGSLTDVGAIYNAELGYAMNANHIKADNVGTQPVISTVNEEGTLTFEVAEHRMEILSSIFSGITTYSTTAASLVSGATFVIASGSTFEQAYEITGQNASGAAPTVTSVVGSVNGALVNVTDYWIVKMPNGRWGLAIHDSATVTTMAQTFTLTYDYTPAASKNLSFGGLTSITNRYIRLTNTDRNTKTFVVDIYNAKAEEGFTKAFKSDEDTELNVIPVKFTLFKDVSRTAGDQLFKITSQQYT